MTLTMPLLVDILRAFLFLLCICKPGQPFDMVKITSPQTIQSPNYPEPYQAGVNDKYFIEAPEGMVIKFVIENMDIRKSEYGDCKKGADSLRFGDLYDGKLNVFQELCGDEIPTSLLITKSNRGYVRFMTQYGQSSHNREYSGFSLRIMFVYGPCGQSKYPDAGEGTELAAPRVIGGIPAREGEFPWQVSLSAEFEDGSLFQLCGGVIINEYWVATAGYCDPMSDYSYDESVADIPLQVRVGSNKFNASGVVHDIDFWIVNDLAGTDEIGLPRDYMALVKLTKPIQMNDNVRPICAPSPSVDYTHMRAVVSGYGLTDLTLPLRLPESLQYIPANITTNEECGILSPLNVRDTEICTTDNQDNIRNPCFADAGSPLVVEDDCGFACLGLAALVPGACGPGLPIYISIQYFADWITDVITNN